ncbi:MAG: hypothetical protein IJQ23_04645, partial [Clostridia bacterium]|nr:hypothetical protein [Clostridia bacterium]
SSLLCIIVLAKNKGICKLEFKYLKIYKKELKEMIAIGIPSGLQSMSFSITNVIIASTINKLNAMAGYTLGSQFTNIVYHTGHSVALGTMTFVSQNYGANNVERIKKTICTAIGFCIFVSLIVGTLLYFLSIPICAIMTDSPEVVAEARRLLLILCFTYWVCNCMDMFGYSLRALGKSVVSFVVCFMGIIVFRLVWIAILINFWQSTLMVYLCWPISWVLTGTVLAIILTLHIKRLGATCLVYDTII